jgi:glyoxylase-like metal-dependent hydrolase (beta-lactamase superfamily II)
MTISRRDVLGAISAMSALAAPTISFAAAPMSGGQQISVHRMKLGNFEVTSMLDGYIDIPTSVLQGNAGHISDNLARVGQRMDAPIRFPVNTFLVNTGSKLVLIDAGGAKLLGPTAGRLPQCLAAAGHTLDQIDEVYITHMHGDHLHGTVTPEGGRMFPNAILRIAKADVDYWGSAQVEAAAPEAQKGRFVPAKRAIAAYGDRLKPFELGVELTPGIRSVNALGHTPGHSCFMVESEGKKLLLLGDLMHVAAVQFPNPEITVVFDWDQNMARSARKALFEQVAREKILIGAVHIAFPGIGSLREVGTGYVFDPVQWQLF